MSDVPRLSIVIPTFNTAAMTLGCGRAVLAARPERCELIIVDDASTDETSALLRAELPEALTITLAQNRRFSGAANAGSLWKDGNSVSLTQAKS